MKMYEIWSEGYQASPDCGSATLHGSIMADSLKNACILFSENNPEFKKYVDLDKLTFWNCRIFDNETDARKYFG